MTLHANMAIPDSQGYPEKINQMLTIKKKLIIFKYNFSKNLTRALPSVHMDGHLKL